MGVVEKSGRAFAVVVTVLIALAAVPVAIFLVVSATRHSDGQHDRALGPLLGLMLALLPVVPLALGYAWLGRYDPPPRMALLRALGWGVTVAPALAIGLELAAQDLTSWPDRIQIGVVAPFVEEGAKGLFVLLLLWFHRRELSGFLDAVTFAGLAGVGFAFSENILYLAAAFNGTHSTGAAAPTIDGAVGLGATFVMRCLISPFAHPLFTSFTGIGVGVAVVSTRRAVRVMAPMAGYLCAVVGHLSWNSSLVAGPLGFVLVYAAVMLPAVAGVVVVLLFARRGVRRTLTDSLRDAAARGYLPAMDIGWVVDLTARRRAQRFARQEAGEQAERAMREYQRTAAEFGILHARYLRGTPPPDTAARAQEYVARIGTLRRRIAFPGQVVFTR